MDPWKSGKDFEDAADRKFHQATEGCDSCCKFFSTSPELKEAIDLYVQAAEKFEAAGDGVRAAKIHGRTAECYLKMRREFEGMEAYVAAADCSKIVKDDTVLISYLQRAIDIGSKIGKHIKAADICREFAEYFEALEKLEPAFECYEKAYDIYQIRGSSVLAEQCKLKVAFVAALVEKYQKAKEIYEETARKSRNATLEKYKFRGYLLNAIICLLCDGNIDAMSHASKEYQELDQKFSTTREFEFFCKAMKSFVEADVAKFRLAVNDYDGLVPLDPWKRTLLSRVETKLRAREMELQLRARETEEIEEIEGTDYITGA